MHFVKVSFEEIHGNTEITDYQDWRFCKLSLAKNFEKYFLKALAEHLKTQCNSESFKGKLGKRSISLDHDHTN